MNYICYYLLFIYKLSNKHIKHAICIPRLSRHVCVITQYRSTWAGFFFGPYPARTKNTNFDLAERSDDFDKPEQNAKS